MNKKGDYELIDSGDGEKLERFGPAESGVFLRRPDPEALWQKSKDENYWQEANLSFKRVGTRGGNWKHKGVVLDSWVINYGGFKFKIMPTSFKHVGIFPEQIDNWNFIKDIKSLKGKRALNLFGYTGGATLACARSGMEVTHVDASKPVVEWAKENAKLNGLENEKIRFLIDDTMAFLKKEVKRGNKYDAIIMDPPAFGHGPEGEVWKIEDDFIKLMNLCLEVLNDSPSFFIVSGYASGYSKIVFENNLKVLVEKFGGKLESLELLIEENSPRGFFLPAGVTARWKR
ncbi:MAG TPA: class I SAM-dependent methyltransferase [Candidatus Paceibacterota bacterium]|nr:class I SAM-dependent methyltransferase [Candidatus Paceibacterota bacterium]